MLRQVEAAHLRQFPRFCHKAFRMQVRCRDDAGLGAEIAEMTRQRPGIDPVDADDPVLRKILVERFSGPPVARDSRNAPSR